VTEIKYKIDINTLHKIENDLRIGMNDIGRVRLRTTVPPFLPILTRPIATTGGLILIDPDTNNTVAAGDDSLSQKFTGENADVDGRPPVAFDHPDNATLAWRLAGSPLLHRSSRRALPHLEDRR